jgi:PAS domain S-box-containing protein
VRYVYQNAEIRHDEAGNACRIFGIIQDITARNEVVKALEESEHRFKMLFECAPDAIYLTDMNGNFVDGNKVAEKLIGYKREELIGTNFVEAGLLPPEQVPKALAGLEKNANGEPTGPDEFTLIHKNGSSVPVEIRTFPVRIGNEILALGIARDVTERKLTEEALRESEQKYKELFENAREAIVIIDMDKRITDANKFIEEYGFSKGDLIGRNYLDFVAEEYKEKAIEDFEKLRRGIPQEGEFNVITPKGNIIVYYRDNPIIRDGSVIGVQAVLTDITERKWAEDALRTSEARLSEAMKIAKLGYWEYDVADNVFIFNDQFYSVYRTSAEQVGGYQVSPSRYAELFLHPDDAPKLRKEIRKAVETTDPNFRSEGEHSIIYGDGKIGYVSVRYFVVKDSQGRTVKTHGVNQDITERKKAEGKLREYHVKLKAMTSEVLRTEERERHRIAIGLHDNICQNLVLTKVLLQSVLRLVSDPSVSGPLKMASETMGELIEQANSLTFELSNPILHELGFVLAMKKHLTEEVQEKHGIACELEGSEGLRIPDEEIKSALFRISRELLMNIVKHAQARNVKVSIHKRRSQIHLVIQDNGVGFDSSKVSSELFRTSRFGLFSIQEQLEHLGGSFEIESEPGRGTTATVVVPLGENTVG